MQCKCGNKIPTGRVNLGYSTCLACGDVKAKEETAFKSKCVMPMSKSNYVYVSSKEQVKEISGMRRSTD